MPYYKKHQSQKQCEQNKKAESKIPELYRILWDYNEIKFKKKLKLNHRQRMKHKPESCTSPSVTVRR